MNYTKSVIALVFEIRKKVPPEYRDEIKLTNSQLDIDLVGLYKITDDIIVQALIKEVLLQMSTRAFEMLSSSSNTAKKNKGSLFSKKAKMYRGRTIEQNTLKEGNEPPILNSLAVPEQANQEKNSESKKSQSNKRKRIYRGKVIED